MPFCCPLLCMLHKHDVLVVWDDRHARRAWAVSFALGGICAQDEHCTRHIATSLIIVSMLSCHIMFSKHFTQQLTFKNKISKNHAGSIKSLLSAPSALGRTILVYIYIACFCQETAA